MHNNFSRWFNLNYMWIFNGLLLIFIFFAFLAPVLMKIRLEIPAKLIYRIYSYFCHQLSFRSYFLFGNQIYYPRKISGEYVQIYYDNLFEENLNLEKARNFVGNEEIGYKVALCQRDIAIYGTLLFTGFFFQITHRKIKPIPLSIWIIVGLIPLGLDGISQFGGLGIELFSFLPVRESSPVLRTITGSLFGGCTGLLVFPMIEESIQITKRNYH